MEKKEFLKKIENIKNSNVNDKIFRDFIKFFANKNNLVFTNQNIEQMSEYVKKTAIFNNRDFVAQSDLWAILYVDIFDSKEMIDKFKTSIFETMFKKEIEYLDQNSSAKDFLTELFEKKELSKTNINDAKKLFEWTDKHIQELEKAKPLAINSIQIKNILTGENSLKFFNDNHDKIIRIFKWQKHGFEMVSEVKLWKMK